MPNFDVILDHLLTAPDSQLDASMKPKLEALRGKSDEELKTGLHEVLDHCARYSLASGFVMKLLNYEWESRGGKVTDPAPWQDEMP